MTDEPRDHTHVLRVMTWNVHGSAHPNRNGLARVIRSLHPDVVFLQEIQIGQAHRLANRLGMRVLWARKHFPYGPALWWRAEGHAVLSTHRISPVATWLLSPDEGPSTWRRRIAQRADLHMRDTVVPIVNTHLASHAIGGPTVPDGPTARRAQAELLAKYLNKREGGAPLERLIVAGDLNTDREPGVLGSLLAIGLRDCWTALPYRPHPGHTAPAAQPQHRIDYVLAGPAWTVTDVLVPNAEDTEHDWKELSDHLPVVADLSW